MRGDRADADDDRALAVLTQRLFNELGGLLQIARADILAKLLNEHHVALAHGKREAGLAVREDVLYRLHGQALKALVQAADQEHAAVELGLNVQLLGADIEVAEHDVVGDDVLDEGDLVVLLLIIALGRVERDRRHGAGRAAHLVLAIGKNRKIKVSVPAGQRLEGLAGERNHALLRVVDAAHKLAPMTADLAQLRTGNDGALGIDHADLGIDRILELQNDVLENSP